MSENQNGETEKERLDRNLDQMLQELRVALPGVQVLFAFLLTVPFSNGFPTLTGFQRDLYFVVLALTALSAALLIAPSAYHRLLFREGAKRPLVMYSNRIVIAGLGVLALAMTAAVTLIAHVVFGGTAAFFAGAAAALMFVILWGLVPVRIRQQVAAENGDD
jgi:hypothetical protein